MNRQSKGYRLAWTAVALVAALGMLVRGIMEWNQGPGRWLVILAAAMVVAVFLRRRVFTE